MSRVYRLYQKQLSVRLSFAAVERPVEWRDVNNFYTVGIVYIQYSVDEQKRQNIVRGKLTMSN